MVKLLIADNDVHAAKERSKWFGAHHHYLVDVVNDGRSALNWLECNKFDAIVVVEHLPQVSGIELCKTYRQHGGQTPILMLGGSRPETASAERALDSGVDDFVPNQCALSELSARIRALLRRPPGLVNNLLQAGNLVMDTSLGQLFKAGAEIRLQPMELNLLEFFMRHPNQVFSARTLHVRIWREQIGSGSVSDTVRTHIKTLRKKLDDHNGASIISTVHGRGYKLTAQV